jgi:hypothetical protein
MINLEDFHVDFLQSILIETESRGLLKHQAFFENVCEDLVSIGDLSCNYTLAEYSKIGMEVHGYDYDEERQLLSLIVHHFFQIDEMQTLTLDQIKTKFNRVTTYYEKCLNKLYDDLEPADDAYSMSYNIYQKMQNKKIDKVRLLVLTDGKATRNLKELPSKTIDGIEIEYRVIDIEYLYKIHSNQSDSSDNEINVSLPCLRITTNSIDYKSYLTAISGELLADIYERFGQKLFEQNVRTFLQFRGNVNKGIINTIKNCPEKFFAYNNGITATASKIEFDDNHHISKIINLQIVNGGQTTSAIYAARKKDKLPLSDLSVQMKISVVKVDEMQNDFVSNVSRFANTQNKVNDSDFFSNSPFHKEMKDFSKRIWVPATGGVQRRTHWFYERVRGEYLNEQAYFSDARKKTFATEFPKSQFVDKRFISKSEVSWMQKPNVVSKGVEYSFDHFAKERTGVLEKDNLVITEQYFKDVISRVIMFREVEKIVSNSEWYNNAYRAQIVTYSISYLSFLITKKGKYLNFNTIWDKQCLPSSLVRTFKFITKSVNDYLTETPDGYGNISQWCKNEKCWNGLKDESIYIEIDDTLLVSKASVITTTLEDKNGRKLEIGIEIQAFVVNLNIRVWQIINEYFSNNMSSGLSFKQRDILNKMSLGMMNPPSELQAKILYELYLKAKNEGVQNV